MSRRRASEGPGLTSGYVPGGSFARTLWSEDWLAAHTWADPAEPDAPRVAELCFSGPAGTGKTRNVLEWLHRELRDNPNTRVLLCRAYRSDLTQGAMVTFQTEVLPEGAFGSADSDAAVRFHGERQAYLYRNGSELVVKGLRDSHGIYSQQYDHIFVNEAGSAHIHEADWDQLKRAKRNRRTKYSLLLGDLNAEHELHWLHQRCDDGATIEVPTAHEDNPRVTTAYLHDLATMRDQTQRARLYLGQRVSAMPGAYYQEQLAQARIDGRITRVPHQRGVPVHTCWDVGWSDYTAIWFFQRVRGEWHFLDYLEADQRDLDWYSSMLGAIALERRFSYGTHCLPHDVRQQTLAAGGKSIERQLRGLGLGDLRVVPQTAEQAQLAAVRAALDSCWFDHAPRERPPDGQGYRRGVAWGLQRLAGFHAEEDERLGVLRPRPAHDLHSHGAKAFATGVLANPSNDRTTFDRDARTELGGHIRAVKRPA